MKRIILVIALCLPSLCLAQGGNCEAPEKPTIGESDNLTPVRFSGSGFKGKNRKPVPTRREAELLKKIEKLNRKVKELTEALDEACSKLPKEGNGWPGGRVPSWYPYPGTMESDGDLFMGNG